jgi:hypothetical protein
MRPFAAEVAARLIECLLPRDLSEPVVGDLYEELALRARSPEPRRAVAWFMLQALSSVPRLFLMSVRHWFWFKSLGVAAIAFLVLGQVEPLVHRWLAGNFEPSVNQQIALSLLVGFTACACGGFLATWMRRGSALFYSVIGTGVMVSAIASVDTNEPVWFLTAFVLIATLAPIVGGLGFVALANRWQKRRRN